MNNGTKSQNDMKKEVPVDFTIKNLPFKRHGKNIFVELLREREWGEVYFCLTTKSSSPPSFQTGNPNTNISFLSAIFQRGYGHGGVSGGWETALLESVLWICMF
jgi:hypothetical protein